MDENPLDLEQHDQESAWDVWKRRLMFLLLIALCVTFAAPSFSGCEGAFDGTSDLAGTFRVGGEDVHVSRKDFAVTKGRLELTYSLLGKRFEDEDQETWTHIVLNAAAEAHGVHVPPTYVTKLIASLPGFAQGEEFDERVYRQQLHAASRGNLTHREFARTIAEARRVELYRQIVQSVLLSPSSETAYESWKERNAQLTVEYVVQPFEPLQNEVAEQDPGDEVLRPYAATPDVASALRIPPRKVVEAAYLRVREMETDAAVEALTSFLKNEGAVRDDLDRQAMELYYSGESTIYTRANWLAMQSEYYQLALDAYENDKKAWEEKGSPEGEEPPKPPNPADEQFSTEFQERFFTHWKDFVVKEILARELTRIVAERAERESKSFAELLPEYEQFGLAVVRNEEALPDLELVAKFPQGLGIDSEMDSTVTTYLQGPRPGTPFTAKVHTVPVPTTRLGSALNARGFMVLRLAEYTPPGQRDFEEAREEILTKWRENKVQELARDQLASIRDGVADGSKTLEQAAADAGLAVQTMSNFSASTPERRVPPESDENPEAQAAAQRILWRNRIVGFYRTLQSTEAGEFHSKQMVDAETNAAYLVRVVDKREPGPLEVSAEDLRAELIGSWSKDLGVVGEILSYDAIARRFGLTLTKDTEQEEESAGGPAGTSDSL